MATSKIEVIYPRGDLMLCAGDFERWPNIKYRVSSERICWASQYFNALLKPTFSEGNLYVSQASDLFTKYAGRVWEAHDHELPTTPFTLPEEVGRSEAVLGAAATFLKLIHRIDISAIHQMKVWALVGVIADHFAAIDSIKEFATAFLDARMSLQSTVSGHLKNNSLLNWRQGLYQAHLYSHLPAFSFYSSLLIEHGCEIEGDETLEYPWMSLPSEIEEELHLRRALILKSIASIPAILLKPYIHKTSRPVCKMGLLDSPSCDSFQLGEAIKWLVKKECLMLTSPFDSSPATDKRELMWIGSIKDFIKILKGIPEYQIDDNHRHCGIRGDLRKCLETIEKLLSKKEYFGLCGCCWNRRNDLHTKYPVSWKSATDWFPGVHNLPGFLQHVGEIMDIWHRKPQDLKLNSNGACSYASAHKVYADVFGGQPEHPDGETT